MIEKENEEALAIEKSTTLVKMSKNSELILKQKFERSMNEQMKTSQIPDEYDLWPVNLQKNYFEK